MCGRYANTCGTEELNARFDVGWVETAPPHYNIAPGQQVAIVREGERAGDGAEAKRELAFVRWGLIPSWAKDPAIGHRLINARAETLGEKPAFRNAWRRHHCLIPATAFYEWQGAAGHKQPWCVAMADNSPFGMAGLWERWRDPAGEVLETCTIITTDANALLSPIHDRMPLIIAPENYAAWLNSANPHAEKLVQPYPPERMRAWRVSMRVNTASHDDPACMDDVEDGT
ncbi:MAG TPA: SOS response-associated peptidase [Gallionellaceae bacterium]|nr:SOS response-associated peptidase [Gallionellaceae bacterium]